MPRRKFGRLKGKNLRKRTKSFLQELGFSTFDPNPIIAQLPKNDIKIKFPASYHPKGMEFKVATLPGVDGQFEYIQVECPKYHFFFIVYISEKQLWRAFVPTKGNSFCKKKKKVYGFCGCHDESVCGTLFPGSSEHEIVKRMQQGEVIEESINVKVKNWNVKKKGGSTTDWKEEEVVIGDTSEPSEKRICVKVFDQIGLIKDIAWCILEFVDHKDAFRYRRVCKLWNNIIRSEYFQKKRWGSIYKEINEQRKEDNNRLHDPEFQNMMSAPNYFSLDVDGTFESLYYTKKKIQGEEASEEKDDHYYYRINLCQCLIQSFVKDGGKRFGILPYPMHGSIPYPVLIDLNQQYEPITDLEVIRKNVKDENIESYGYCYFDNDAIVQIKKILEQKKIFQSYTVAKTAIMKMLRTETEFEYFDHHIPGKGNKLRNLEWRIDRCNEGQDVIQSYLETFYTDGHGNYPEMELKRLKTLINRVRENTKDLTLYRTSSLGSEELGYLWIVGERDGFLVGVTIFLAAN